MKFDIFTLHPNIFDSFFSESLIARALSKSIIQESRHNFRDFGIGNYKAVDDRPFGGGSGMVIRPEPIYENLNQANLVSTLFKDVPNSDSESFLPNNSAFEDGIKSGLITKKTATIMLTPRGYPLNQQICEWLASDFDKIGLLCGRYEGFDARINEAVDLEISLGDFVLNGGEVAAMALIESVSRLLPDFITKENSVLHDSFSSSLNNYRELEEYIVGKNKYKKTENLDKVFNKKLFNDKYWLEYIAPKIEHPQYTRPEEWKGRKVPEILTSGDHKKVDIWRKNDWRK